MKFCKVINNIVIQTQRSFDDGFIECPESVHCGMVKDGNNYTQPKPIKKTPAQIEARKIKQVDSELGKDNIRIIIETILPMFQDGSLATATADDILIAAKSKRKNEL